MSGRSDEAGNAIVEFLAVALVLMLPLVYLVLAVFEVERNVFAVKQAAREAGRALATAGDLGTGLNRARYAADLALADQRLPAGGEQVSYVPAGASCGAGNSDAATLQPGADFVVCVSRSIGIPGVGRLLSARGITVTGRYVVHVDQFRARS